jgi:Tol biopolymer transport system component
MRWTASTLLVGTLLGGLGVAPAALASEASPEPTYRLLDVRRIELPDVRIISMSPEGGSIAGVKPAIGYSHGELCSFDIQTLAERACTSIAELGSPLRIEDVRWSPDGSSIAFTAQAFQRFHDGDLWLMDATTGSVTNLDDDGYDGQLPFGGDSTGARVTVDVAPAFTPDGRALSFSRSILDGSVPTGNDIATVPLDGGDPVSLATVSDRIGALYFGMAWAPDGTYLAYSHHEPDPDDPRNGIWRIDPAGSGRELIAGRSDPELGAPALAQISPAADRILAWYPISAMRYSGREALAVVDIESGAITPIHLEEPDSAVAAITLAAFSPDGSALLEVTTRTDPDHQVLLRDLATGQVTTLLAEGLESAGPPQYGMMPTWATNGTVLITGGGDLSGATLLTLGAE